MPRRTHAASSDEDKWKKMEAGLEAEADKKGFTGERRRRYIYGAKRKAGWKPSREKK